MSKLIPEDTLIELAQLTIDRETARAQEGPSSIEFFASDTLYKNSMEKVSAEYGVDEKDIIELVREPIAVLQKHKDGKNQI